MSLLKARLQGIRYEAEDVLSFILRGVDGDLPAWSAGSHIDIHLPNGMMRSYSLSNLRTDEKEYRLTVQRDPATRGGSKAMHDEVRVGQVLEISTPRNNFELCETAERTVFLAGGIGITPFLPMAQRLNTLGRSWTLHYSVRTPARAAHLDELNLLTAPGLGSFQTTFDGLPGVAMLDLRSLIASLASGTHVYCCGPEGMLNAFRSAASALPPEQVHFEYFSSSTQAASRGGYVVVLEKSRREILVKEGQTVLQALLAAGVSVNYSCEEGVCGACETRVLSGTPDHRDMILSERERAEGKTMMVCCSGSKSDRLVLDL